MIAQFYTENITYGEYSEKINQDYCTKQGYSYYCEKDSAKIRKALQDRAPTWYKPLLLLEVFEKFNPEFVLFLDMDAIVSDMSQRIETFIQNTDLTITNDYSHHCVANAGVFILKNTEWTRKFLNDWWDSSSLYKGTDSRDIVLHEVSKNDNGYFKNAHWHDQTCFTILYEKNEDIRNNTTIITNRSLNHREYNQNNFIFHAFGYGHVPCRTIDAIYRKLYNKPKTKHINLIVYHIFCHGDYINRVKKQMDRLITSGVYEWCDKLVITCISTDNQFDEIEAILQLPKVELHKYVDNNYELYAVTKLWEYAQEYSGKVLYFHTKGVYNVYKSMNDTVISEWKKKGVSWWIEAMEYFLIDNFKDCVEKLDTYDQCGLTMNNKWWWGNFWWCNLDWISTVSKPVCGSRWSYEAWLNNSMQPTFHEYYHFNFNPYYTFLPDDIYREKNKYSSFTIENAFYGTIGEQKDEGQTFTERTVIDVSDIVKSRTTEKKINIPVENSFFGNDPIYGIVKCVEIHIKINNEDFIIVADEGQYLDFSL